MVLRYNKLMKERWYLLISNAMFGCEKRNKIGENLIGRRKMEFWNVWFERKKIKKK